MAELTEAHKRMTLSRVVEMLLNRGSSDRSSVSIGRNPAGAIVFDVSVRTGDDGDVLTVADAEAKALKVFERLQERFPLPPGHENAEVTLTRNAKGETQIAVSAKTGDTGYVTIADATHGVKTTYDGLRGKYPMADGLTAKPGSVT